jgi:uncharacterized protein (TIGR02466 family)
MAEPSEASLGPGLAGMQFLSLFPIPVFRIHWQDAELLNAQLKQVILARMEQSPGVVKTNRGGWQSKADLQDWSEECVRTFMARSHAAIQEIVRRTVPNPTDGHFNGWQVVAWANVNRKGAFNTAHHHYGFGTIWSSFYYVDPGLADSANAVTGCTKFQDRSGVPKEILLNPDPFEREIAVKPEAGVMLIFPSTLYHYVERYAGDRERVTIAFNMKHRGFVIPMYEGMEEKGWWWENFRGFMILPQKVPEKLVALRLLPGRCFARKLPRTIRPGPWIEHLRSAVDEATSDASARAQLKKAQAKPH